MVGEVSGLQRRVTRRRESCSSSPMSFRFLFFPTCSGRLSLSLQVFKPWMKKGYDIRPSIAVTKAHIDVPEVREAIRANRLRPDGEVLHSDGQSSITKVCTHVLVRRCTRQEALDFFVHLLSIFVYTCIRYVSSTFRVLCYLCFLYFSIRAPIFLLFCFTNFL